MRLIAIVADTHVPSRASEVPAELLKDLERHEPFKIFHAGDLTAERVLDAFEFIAPTHAVKGNNDTGLDLPGEYSETFEEVTVAVRHRPHLQTIETFADRHDADIVIHGHTHVSKVEEQNEMTVLNPGSPTIPRSGEPTYALVSIEGEQFDIELKRFAD